MSRRPATIASREILKIFALLVRPSQVASHALHLFMSVAKVLVVATVVFSLRFDLFMVIM